MRLIRRRFVFSVLSGALIVGCDRPKETQVASSQAAPATVSPTPEPATTQPASQPAAPPIAMRIEDRLVQFPSAILRVGESDGKVVALLYTNDPKDAIKDQYAGNSFYFQMELDANEVKHFTDSDWRFKADSTQPTDTPYGIFLDGNRKQLQPTNVAISFEPAGAHETLISISGEFLMVNVDDATQPARSVKLLAEFTAKTVVKS